MVRRNKNHQFVWPKDGPQGKSGHRGFWGRLNNIVTGKGPDVFLQREGSSIAIRPDHWGNWDSFHHHGYHLNEQDNRFVSRGYQRYDPYSKRYKTWEISDDWNGYWKSINHYPRFTQDEARKLRRQRRKNGRYEPENMGSEWHAEGPKRFRIDQDLWWQEAHRVGQNLQFGFPLGAGVNPLFRMRQRDIFDLQRWADDEV